MKVSQRSIFLHTNEIHIKFNYFCPKARANKLEQYGAFLDK